MNIQHEYKPTPTQRAFHECNKRYRGFKGAKGSGKTRGLVEEIIALLYEFPGNRGILARLNFDDLRETTMQFFFEAIPDQLIIQHNRAESWVTVRSKDPSRPSRLKFAHCKDPKSFESGEIGFFAFDEADQIPLETFKTLRTRLRLKGVAHYGLMAFNPPDPFHWLYKFFVKEPEDKPELDSNRQLFSNNTYENMANLPSNYVDELKETYKGDDLNRFLYGEWGSLSNEWAVWPEFRSQLHIASDPIEVVRGIPIVRAHDFGMWAGLSFHQLVEGQWRILWPDVLEFGKGAEQMAPIVHQKSFEHFSDSAFIDLSEPFARNRATADASITCVNIYKRHNIALKIMSNSWMERMNSVSYFLSRVVDGEAAFQIDPRCERLITALSGAYQFEENTQDRIAARVKDNEYTHLADTIQFAGCYFMGHAKSAKVSLPSPPQYRFGGGVPDHKVVGGVVEMRKRGR